MNGIVKESLKIPARVWQQVVNEFVTAESVAPLEKIRARTLIIWGDKEATFSRTEQDALLAAISGSRRAPQKQLTSHHARKKQRVRRPHR